MPVRLDFFGNEIDEIKFFNPISQTTECLVDEIEITPISYFVFNQETISSFRSKFRDLFQSNYKKSFFYTSVSAGEKILIISSSYFDLSRGNIPENTVILKYKLK